MTYIPDALRQEVAKRAKFQCEYCLLHEEDSIYSHEVDHIIATKHRGETISENLCYACLECNRHKGSDFGSFDAETGDVVLLFHPRKDAWSEHFEVNGTRIIPKTSIGRVTEFVLKLNSSKRLKDREALIEYGRYPPPD